MHTMNKKLLREMFGAKLRFAAITLVVIIGVMVFVATAMSYLNLDTSYQYTYQRLNFADFRVNAGRIPRYSVEEIRMVDGIDMATPRVKTDLPVVMSDGKHLLGRVKGVPYQRPIVDDLLIEKGRFFNDDETGVCIAESHFADFYKLEPGDFIYYYQDGTELPLEIVGIAASPEYLVLAGERGDISPILSATAMAVLYAPLPEAQRMAGLPNSYNQVLCTVDDPDETQRIINEVRSVLAGSEVENVITREDHLGNQLLQVDLETFRSFALFFPILFLGIACMSIYILLSRMAHSQRPFIGVMRAMGYSRRQILWHYLSFSLVVGIVGAVLGAVGGYFLTYLITGVYAGTIGIPLVSVSAYWWVIAAGFFLSITFCMIAGAVPAFRSARLDPSKAMRGEMLKREFKRPLIERVVPFIRKVPLFLKLPFRNMFRNRRRTILTVTGLVLAAVIVMVFLTILDTADSTLTQGFTLNNRFDMVAIFLGMRDEKVVASRLAEIPGVERAESLLSEDCTVEWDDRSEESVLMGVRTDTEMKGFYTPEGEEVGLNPRRALLNQWFREETELKVGDEVTISTPSGSEEFIIGAFIEDPLGNLLYVSREYAEDLMSYGQLGRGNFYIKARPGDLERVREDLRDLDGLVTTIDIEEIKREVDHYMDLLYAIVYIMLVFALIMAFTLTINSITVNILEREREVATMRTIGTPNWKLSAMISVENLIYGIVAIAPGLVLGLLVANYALSLAQSENFSFHLMVYTRTYFYVAGGLIAVPLLCGWPSLRYVRKVELAKATKERGT